MGGGGVMMRVRGAGGRWRAALAAALLLALVLAALGAPAPAAAATITVNSDADSGGTCIGSAPCTLRQAIIVANDNDTIAFDPSVATITLASTLPTITRTLTIAGPGKDVLTIAGNQTFPLLVVNAPTEAVAVSGLTLTGGKATSTYGGNLRSTSGNLRLTDVALTGARGAANIGGGGAYLSNGTFTLTRVTVSGNVLAGEPTYGAGAGLFIDNFYGATTVNIADSTITDNWATDALWGRGGGLAVLHDHPTPATALNVVLTNTEVIGNDASSRGGGIYVDATTVGGAPSVTLINGTVSGNTTTTGDGVGVYVATGSLVLLESKLVGNEAATNGNGGGLALVGGSATLINSTVADNTTKLGGGIAVAGGTLLVFTSIVSGNRANLNGGGTGGGFYVAGGTTTLVNSTVSGNAVYGLGGGFLVESGTLSLLHTTISDNSAYVDGDALSIASGADVTLTASIIAGNETHIPGNECVGTFSSGGSNVVGTTCAASANNTLDLEYTGLIPDLLLPLADNGGLTLTHALAPASVAIERAPAATCAAIMPNGAGGVDQRGQPRPATGYCDSGAFERPPPTVAVGIVGNGTVQRSPAGEGADPGPYAYTPFGTVILTAVPAPGNSFVGWTRDGNPAGSALTLQLDTLVADTSVVATFAPQRTLTIITAGDGSGTVARSPAGTGTGPFFYDQGTAVTLTAIPNPGSRFARWRVNSVPQPGTEPLLLTLTADTIVSATFVAQATLTLTTVGGGTVQLAPPGGAFASTAQAYDLGTVATLTPQPAPGQTFVGWTVDGVPQGWVEPLTITMNAAHTVVATFKPTLAFPDVGSGRADHFAITELASRGTIKGYQDGRYGPDDRVRRDQMAALIARAMPAGPDTPPTTLTPPACLVAGSWDCENWGNTFSDRGGVDANLWRNAGTMQHYGVSIGYAGATCAAKRVPSPCYGPGDNVTYAQTISFITRAMKAKGYWVDQPGAPLPYQNVPPAHQLDVRTFHFYTSALGGVPSAPTTLAGWDAGATRGWFARALWHALDSHWFVDRVP